MCPFYIDLPHCDFSNILYKCSKMLNIMWPGLGLGTVVTAPWLTEPQPTEQAATPSSQAAQG